MTLFVTIDKSGEFSAEANGHPTECTEPVDGQVQSTDSHSVTITNSDGDSKEIATADSADIYFDSHAHTYDSISGCIDKESHNLDPDAVKRSQSVTINGSSVYLKKDAATTDPTSDGDVNFTGAGVNNSLDQT